MSDGVAWREWSTTYMYYGRTTIATGVFGADRQAETVTVGLTNIHWQRQLPSKVSLKTSLSQAVVVAYTANPPCPCVQERSEPVPGPEANVRAA